MLRLKELRQSRGFTQQQVAEYLEITQAAYSLYELGKRQADYKTLTRLSAFFGVSVDYILGVSDDLGHRLTDLETYLKCLPFELKKDTPNDIVEQICCTAIRYLDDKDKYTVFHNIFDLLSSDKYKDLSLNFNIQKTDGLSNDV